MVLPLDPCCPVREQDLAIDSDTKALQLNPKMVNAMYNRGWEYAQKGSSQFLRVLVSVPCTQLVFGGFQAI